MKLTKEQKEFLEKQGVHISAAFDASGMPNREYRALMKKLGKLVAFGVTPCRAAGHTLRTRHGHCIQCGTHHIAFIKRYSDSGKIYIACSELKGLAKVGVTQDLSERMAMLNYYGYAGASDWKVLYANYVKKNVGRVENMAHNMLVRYKVEASYIKDGKLIESQEVFDCDYEIAVSEVKRSVEYVEKNFK